MEGLFVFKSGKDGKTYTLTASEKIGVIHYDLINENGKEVELNLTLPAFSLDYKTPKDTIDAIARYLTADGHTILVKANLTRT